MNVSLWVGWGRKKTQNTEMISAAHSVLKQASEGGARKEKHTNKGGVHQASYCLTVPQPQVSLEASEQGTQHKSKGAGEFACRDAGLLVPQCAWLSFVLDIPFGGERVPLGSDGWKKRQVFMVSVIHIMPL